MSMSRRLVNSAVALATLLALMVASAGARPAVAGSQLLPDKFLFKWGPTGEAGLFSNPAGAASPGLK